MRAGPNCRPKHKHSSWCGSGGGPCVPGYSKAIPTAKKHSQGLRRYWATVEDLGFKIVKTIGGGLLARINEICKAAFEKAIFVYPNEHLEMCQGARVILKSKEQS